MYNNEKTSSFLKAIDKYAKEQHSRIIKEVQEIEKKELEKAEIEIMDDVRNMAQREHLKMKNKITIEISHKELEERKKLAKKRQRIVKEIFDLCKEKLIEYSKSSKYPEYLCRCAYKISSVLKEDDVILYVKEEDIKYSDLIKNSFIGNCKIECTKDIEIGGIKGLGRKRKLIADETLDSNLLVQKDWFASEYGIMLV